MMIDNSSAGTATIRPASAVAAYRQAATQSGMPAQPAQPPVKGFGVIQDIVTLSPAALARIEGESDPYADYNAAVMASYGAGDSANDAAATDSTGKNKPPSDPFRAYRGEDGEISLEAMMQIEMLPPHMRKAGKLMREASSLRDEVNEMSKNPNADQEKLNALKQEYAGKLGELWEELEKLGLASKMKARDMSMDDLLNGGLEGLTALDGGERGGAAKIADNPNRAGLKTMANEQPKTDGSMLDWAFNTLKK